jgi:predicted HicB family RNase H-like nuclease
MLKACITSHHKFTDEVSMEGARKISPMQVRLPPELKEWLKVEAAKNRRSLNSEIVARLEATKNIEPV